jgi:hypothetical protein
MSHSLEMFNEPHFKNNPRDDGHRRHKNKDEPISKTGIVYVVLGQGGRQAQEKPEKPPGDSTWHVPIKNRGVDENQVDCDRTSKKQPNEEFEKAIQLQGSKDKVDLIMAHSSAKIKLPITYDTVITPP